MAVVSHIKKGPLHKRAIVERRMETLGIHQNEATDGTQVGEDRPALRPYVRSSAHCSFATGSQAEDFATFALCIEASRSEYNREIGKLVQEEADIEINFLKCATHTESDSETDDLRYQTSKYTDSE